MEAELWPEADALEALALDADELDELDELDEAGAAQPANASVAAKAALAAAITNFRMLNPSFSQFPFTTHSPFAHEDHVDALRNAQNLEIGRAEGACRIAHTPLAPTRRAA